MKTPIDATARACVMFTKDDAQVRSLGWQEPGWPTGRAYDEALASFLASEESSYISGQVLQVDGAMLT